MPAMDNAMLTGENSEIADRLSISAKSWSRPDALDCRDPLAELSLTLDALNELHSRWLRIATLEHALRSIFRAADGATSEADWASRVSAAMTDDIRAMIKS